jgi:CelD/BcsL family acetyltransferase involved in cellulose biosynthesis
MRWGPVKKRFKIKWEGSFDRYLASLKTTRRTKLRAAERRFHAEFGDKIQLKRYETDEEIDAFLDDAIPVSDKTYQKQLLGLGVARGGHTELELREAAQRGYFRGHVLFVNGSAVAFQYALAYSGTMLLTETGYDPEFAQYGIGSIIFCRVLRDFEQNETGIHTLDFLSGVSVFKERTSNMESQEQDFLLFWKNPWGSFHYWTLSAVNTASGAFGLVLDQLRIKSRLKSLIQRRTGRGHI